jgi:pimeloyl-[acyl-carrier protein] synthase
MLTRDDLTQADFFLNPYPYYAKLRSYGQPFWLPHQQDTSSGGIWLFSRYADGYEIFKQVKGVTKNLLNIRPPGRGSAFDLNLLHRDGADHLRLRRLVSEYFSAQSIEALIPVMETVAEQLLQPLAVRPDFDLITEFAEPMPLQVIAHLVGVPKEDMAQVRMWSLLLSEGFDSLLSDDVVLEKQKQAMNEFLAYVNELIMLKEARPDQSLLGFLVRACGQQLNLEELTAMVGFLLFAGHETTVNLIGNSVWLLLSHPDQWSMLLNDSSLLIGAIEEVLRFESPEQRTSFRLVEIPMEINGHRLVPGQQIGVIIGSINRDETVFFRADEFDIRRSPNKHLAFGLGLHHCLGKTLARIQAQVALSKVLSHLPDLRLTNEQACWRNNSFFRGLAALPVTIRADSLT